MLTQAEQLAGLLKLNGQAEIEAASSALSRNLAMLSLISQALGKGATWADVGKAILGTPDGKLAKRAVKHLAKLTQRDLITRDLSEVLDLDA